MPVRVTQRDVAREAGVSHMTVSLALRGEPGIPETTRKRIGKIAARLGYAPDPMLTALASYRKRQRPAAYKANLAWLNSHPHSGSAGSGDFLLYFEGARDRARKLGYVLEEIHVPEETRNFRSLRRLLRARTITGIVLPPARLTGAELLFDFSRHSAVRIGYSYRAPVVNTVANSQFRTVLTAMQKAVALGYRRIGIILSKEVDERTSWHFLGGYLAGQHMLAPEDRLAPFYETPRVDPASAVFDWIQRERIDCLIAAGYRDLYHSLVRMGLDMPGAVGYLDTQLAEDDAFFSGFHQSARQIGVAATDLLVSMIHRDETGIPPIPFHLLIEGTWHPGKTLPGPARRKPRTRA